MGVLRVSRGFVVGVTGEIAVLQHAQPLRTFLDHTQLKGRPEAVTRREGFDPRLFGIGLQALQKYLEVEFKPLDAESRANSLAGWAKARSGRESARPNSRNRLRRLLVIFWSATALKVSSTEEQSTMSTRCKIGRSSNASRGTIGFHPSDPFRGDLYLPHIINGLI